MDKWRSLRIDMAKVRGLTRRERPTRERKKNAGWRLGTHQLQRETDPA
jgi:hypothetical protein